MKKALLILCVFFVNIGAYAQFNIKNMLISGEQALYYEDYVLSIQYFNNIISLRPDLYRPWQLRGAAKFYLEDYSGAEEDATEAIKLNPYIEQIFDLRAISRIHQQNFQGAIDDYTSALKLNPNSRNYWYNRAICQFNLKNYDEAIAEADTINKRWSSFVNAYSLKAEIYLERQDTTEAVKWLDKSLDIDPYNGNAWLTRASISLSRKEWREADKDLSEVIRLKPKHVPSYINRALCRLNINNIRGAMADYDTALDLDPNNFLAHYNRGLMRQQLGAENDAIEDFSYVIEMEPDNIMAIFNRGVLRQNTGDMRGAIRDYSKVIDQFPNFWTGLSYRAQCYRALGMTGKAELDEFRIFKAQMDKHIGVQPRWSKSQIKSVRKRSEIDLSKYNEIVVDDEPAVEERTTYESEYRGRIQNRTVTFDNRPLFMVSLYPYNNGIKTYQAFDRDVEKFNARKGIRHTLFVACGNHGQGATTTADAFTLIDSLSIDLDKVDSPRKMSQTLLQRAVAYTVVQNYSDAIADLDQVISIDSASVIAYWQRGVCQSLMNSYNIAQGMDAKMKNASALVDLNNALRLAPSNAYILYDRAQIYLQNGETAKAIEDYSEAIKIEPHMAEAYYNRGILYYNQGDKTSASHDLSKAGELGLYDAYSILKKFK